MTVIRKICIILMLVAPTASVAGGNRAFVEQEGSGNNLTIDQSAASASLVRGLGSWSSQNLLPALSSTADDQQVEFDGFFPSSAPSGDALRQFGNNNTAHVTISDEGGIAVLMQLGSGNEGVIDLLANNTRGLLLQDGRNNRGGVEVTAAGASGILEQSGNDNSMDLQVTSPGTRAIVRVHGNGLSGNSPYNIANGNGGGVVEISVTD